MSNTHQAKPGSLPQLLFRRVGATVLAALLAGFGTAARSQTRQTSLHALTALSNAQAATRFQVQFEATVTYYRNYDTDLFVQDGDAAIYVSYREGASLVPGDRVLIHGKTQDSFRPIVVADQVTVLRHEAPPNPIDVTAEQLFSADRDSMLGRIRGTVRSAQMVWSAGRRNLYLQISIEGGYIDAAVNSDDASIIPSLLDAEAEITGIITAEFDQKMQQSGARLDVQSISGVRILKRAPSTPEALPVTPMESILRDYHMNDLSKRIQVKGVITYYQPRRAVVLQSGSQSVWVVTQTDLPLKIGDVAYASGFPNVRNGFVSLEHAEIRDTSTWAQISPRLLSTREIGFAEFAFNLVSAEGELVMEAREAAQDEYVFTAGGQLFSAVYRHPRGMGLAELPPMKNIPLGSRVRVTGINRFYSSDPFDGPVESNLLLRNFDDIVVIAPPSWFNRRNLIAIIAVLLVIVVAISGRGWYLQRNVTRQKIALAEKTRREADLERQRSLILEKINGAGPLSEILELVVHLVSTRLGGAPSWCEIKDGDAFGARPSETLELQIAREELHSGAGIVFGSLSVALGLRGQLAPADRDVLLMGANLASLAIETRRLYADLMHRSNFDMLTEVHSRSFLERQLALQVEMAAACGGAFGLIYFDLDDFKAVNDAHGHRIGDEYLRQVAGRIKALLRTQDEFGRVGGDEFAILVPSVRSRPDLEDIVARLRASLQEPLLIEGHMLNVGASFGMALYPEDGTTRDALLENADKAMYSSKMSKRG